MAVQHDPISKAKYKALRARGHSHGRALRSVTDRLLALRVRCFVTGRALIPVVQPQQYNQHIRDFESRWQ